jgi:hypothetical protein
VPPVRSGVGTAPRQKQGRRTGDEQVEHAVQGAQVIHPHLGRVCRSQALRQCAQSVAKLDTHSLLVAAHGMLVSTGYHARKGDRARTAPAMHWQTRRTRERAAWAASRRRCGAPDPAWPSGWCTTARRAHRCGPAGPPGKMRPDRVARTATDRHTSHSSGGAC